MSDNNQTQSGDQYASEHLIPPGQQLRHARERIAMSLEDAARELRMPVARLRALENDEYGPLKADTFVRGYVRAYAKLLDLEPGPLLEAYQQRAGEFAGPAGSNVNLPAASPRRSPWPLAALVALILGGLWLISVWFFDNRSEPAMLQESVPVSREDRAADAVQEEHSPEQGLDDVTEELEGTATDLQPMAVRPPNLDANAGLDQLYISFAGECWVEVSDAQGDVLHTNLQQSGTELTLYGRAPFSVRMGNGRVVQMRFNGEPVEIPLRSGENVVSMNVGQ